MAMENPTAAGTYGEKMDSIARWLGDSIASMFFTSLERCKCVHVQTEGEDDDDEAHDHPLILTIHPSFNSSASFNTNGFGNVDTNPSAAAGEDIPPV